MMTQKELKKYAAEIVPGSRLVRTTYTYDSINKECPVKKITGISEAGEWTLTYRYGDLMNVDVDYRQDYMPARGFGGELVGYIPMMSNGVSRGKGFKEQEARKEPTGPKASVWCPLTTVDLDDEYDEFTLKTIFSITETNRKTGTKRKFKVNVSADFRYHGCTCCGTFMDFKKSRTSTVHPNTKTAIDRWLKRLACNWENRHGY